MINLYSSILFTTVSFILLCAQVAQGQHSAISRSDFSKNITTGWENALKARRRANIEFTRVEEDRVSSKTTQSSGKLLHYDGSFIKENVSENSQGKERGFAIGMNTSYAFRLTQNENGQWVISGPVIPSDPSQMTGENALLIAPYLQESKLPAGLECYCIECERTIPVVELLEDKTFAVASIAPSPANKGLVRMDFSRSRKLGNVQAPMVGWCDFDPANQWAIVSSHSKTTKEGYTFELLVDYQLSVPDDTGIRIEREIVKFTEVDGGVTRRDWVRTTDYKYHSSDPAATDFTLTAYGLPEPVDIKPPTQSTPLYVYFLTIALALVLLSLGLLWLLKRRQRAASTRSVPKV